MNNDENGIPAGVVKTILMNNLMGRGGQSSEIYLNIYLSSLNEAKKLLNEASILLDNGAHERAYFLGISALEEISKSQLAADVYTGLIDENKFKEAYRDHKKKLARVEWVKIDGNSYPYFSFDSIKIKDFDFQKKLKSMYVDVDFILNEISTPDDNIKKEDAEGIIKAVTVGLHRIYQVTEEDGEQIGTKGFMK